MTALSKLSKFHNIGRHNEGLSLTNDSTTDTCKRQFIIVILNVITLAIDIHLVS